MMILGDCARVPPKANVTIVYLWEKCKVKEYRKKLCEMLYKLQNKNGNDIKVQERINGIVE